MQITKQTVSGVEIFTARGQLDATTSPHLETELLAGVQTGAKQLVVDLEHVSLISSAALRVLLSTAKRMRRQQGRILLCAPSEEVRRVFEVSDLSSLFEIYLTQAAALAMTVDGGGSPVVVPEPALSLPPTLAAPVPTPVPPPPAPAPAAVPAPTPSAPIPPKPEPDPVPVPPSRPPAPPAPIVAPTLPTPVVAATVPPARPAPRSPQATPPGEANGDETLIVSRATRSPVIVTAVTPPAPVVPAPPAVVVIPPPAQLTPAVPVALPPPLRATVASVPAPAAVSLTTPPPPSPPAPRLVSPPSPGPAPVVATPSSPPPPPGAVAATPPRVTVPAVPAPPARGLKQLVLVGLLAIFALTVLGVGIYAWRSLSRPKPSPLVESATPPPAPTLTPPRPVATVAPTPVVTAKPNPTPPAITVTTPPPAREEAAQITVPARANFDPAQRENQEVRESVLSRIELMPISQRSKDQLYAAVNRARRMGKVITITFGSGRTELSAADVEKLRQAVQQPELQALVNDPTSVFVILGYADARGNEQANLQVSERRAQKTMEALRSSCGLLNVMHSLGMGGSDLVDKQKTERNRAVEIWAVLP